MTIQTKIIETIPSSSAEASQQSGADFGRTAQGSSTPTLTIAAQLQFAYSFFNAALFGGELTECVLTLDQSGKTTLGFFKPDSFVSTNEAIAHQISMNPLFVLEQPLPEVMSTLVHEQCHLWIHEFASAKPKNGYHCKKWAAKMIEIGLLPTADGTPDGKKTGYRMSDLIKSGGLFDMACQELLDRDFALSWGLLNHRVRRDNEMLDGDANGHGTLPPKKDRSKGKVKFTCASCGALAWAAPSRHLICGDDMTPLEIV